MKKISNKKQGGKVGFRKDVTYDYKDPLKMYTNILKRNQKLRILMLSLVLIDPISRKRKN